jgi:ribonuclease P protein component
MLPKKNRISKENFPSPKRQGFRVFSQLFSVVFYKGEEEIRMAVVVSKKIAKTAVMRNRIRRKMYSILREGTKRTNKKGTLVIYPKKEALTAKFSVLEKEVVEVIHKVL